MLELFVVALIGVILGFVVGLNFGERKWKKLLVEANKEIDKAYEAWSDEVAKARALSKQLAEKVTKKSKVTPPA